MTDAGELQTLAQLGITSISLVSDGNTFTLPDGSRINGFGSFVRNGATHTLADAQLSFESNGFTKTTQQELTTYTSQDGATVKTYYDTANLLNYNSSPGVSITLPGNYAYEGVLGGEKRDVVDIRFATKSMILYGGAGKDDLFSGAGTVPWYSRSAARIMPSRADGALRRCEQWHIEEQHFAAHLRAAGGLRPSSL